MLFLKGQEAAGRKNARHIKPTGLPVAETFTKLGDIKGMFNSGASS